MSRSCTIFLSFTLFALSSCGPREIEDARRSVLEAWVDGTVIPLYASFVDQAVQFEIQSDAFCQTPTQAGLVALQEAWWRLRAPWKQAEVFAFGPYKEEPLRLGPKVDFWPARPDTIEMTIVQMPPVQPLDVLNYGSVQAGLPVIEYVLFSRTNDDFYSDPNLCIYLRGLSLDLKGHAQEMLWAWEPLGQNYRAQLIDAGRGSVTFTNLNDALSELVNRIGFTIENIRRDKLGKVVGEAGADPQPNKAESQWSGRAIEDVRDNLRGIERLIFTPPELEEQVEMGGGPMSLDEILQHRGHPWSMELRTRLDASFAALDAIPAPLGNAVLVAPETVTAAIDTLGELQRYLQIEVIPALELKLTFNDADGD